MTTYHKRPVRPARCRDCVLPAQWIVEGGVSNYYVGEYCEEHADKAIAAMERYQAAVKLMSEGRR